MNKIILLTLLIFFTTIYSQSDNKIGQIKKEVEKEVVKYKDSLNKTSDKYTKKIDIEFNCDVFRIEQIAKKRMDSDYSTSGMSAAVYELESNYDKLLNKYYTILLNKVEVNDREILKISQRNWIKFRDAEIKLIVVISDNYSSGGSIQNNIVSGKVCELTKQRVFKLKAHIDEFYDE